MEETVSRFFENFRFWFAIAAISISVILMIMPNWLARYFIGKNNLEHYTNYRNAGGSHTNYVNFYPVDKKFADKLLRDYEHRPK